MEKATFGAGCFWGVESFFRKVPGAEEYHQRYLEKNGLPSCHVRMPEAGE